MCLRRFYSHYIWGKNLIKYLASRKKPDVIYCAVPSLTGPRLVANYCKKNNIRFVVDIQDLWPEAFRLVFNVPIISTLIFLPFKIIANGIYKSADAIVAVSKTYADRAMLVNEKNRCNRVVYLGTELKKFDDSSKKEPIIEKKRDEIWIAYCGTLGSSYDLSSVIEAISVTGRKDLHFIIMGDGPLMTQFDALARCKKINATFTGRLPYDVMVSLLCQCDIVVNPIMRGAAQSIINKHADYVASGLPIVSTQENEEFVDLVNKYELGINCKNDDVFEIANAIIKLADNEELRLKLGRNARKCAEELFDRKTSYRMIYEEILK